MPGLSPLDASSRAIPQGDVLVALPAAVLVLDPELRCTFTNPAAERLTGRATESLGGERWSDVVHPDDVDAVRAAVRAPAEGIASDVRLVDRFGTVQRWVTVRAVPLRGPDGVVAGHAVTLDDVSARRHLEERLEFDAMHDRLTGLGSRALLVGLLQAALARTRRGGRGVALLFVDLDGFKRVNDTLGHSAGDELLAQVGQRLRDAVRGSDSCARLGPDEFVVCADEIDAAAPAVQLAERLLATVGEPYDVHGHEVLVGASIGVAIARGEDPVSVDQLLSNADLASTRAKRLGGGRVELFDDDLRRELATGRRIARAVARISELRRVPLRCEPIAELATGAIVAYDCVIDWHAADLPEQPTVIDAVSASAGLARSIDVAVVRTALAMLEDWRVAQSGAPLAALAVPVAADSLRAPGFVAALREQVAAHGGDATGCRLMVPESALGEDAEAIAAIDALVALGFAVGVTDFGATAASRQGLKRAPITTVGFTGPLVDSAGNLDAVDEALLRAIVGYGTGLGCTAMAGGVRDGAHADGLREIGCTHGSGPAFGPPVGPADVRARLANH